MNFGTGAVPGYAAIAVDGSPSTTTFTTATTINVSHTTGSGATLMLVGISISNDGQATSEVTGSVATVTYNGDALTPKCFAQVEDDANVFIYYLVNPDITTANVTVTLENAAVSGGAIGVMTFTGVSTSTPLGNCANSGADEASPMNVDVTSAAGELVFDVTSGEDTTFTVDGSQNQRWNLNADSGNVQGSASTKTGAATVTMQWTLGAENHHIMTGVSIKPSSRKRGLIMNVD